MKQAQLRNLINVYKCEKCSGEIVTVHRAPGTTPMMLKCRADVLCNGRMFSMNYRVSQLLVPTHEWYMPRPQELKRESEATQDHVRQGGLLLREIIQQAEDLPQKRLAPMVFACKRGRR